MGENKTFFKPSLLGGFDKDDVLAYIEKTAIENKDKICELEECIRNLQKDLDDIESEKRTLKNENLKLEERNNELLHKLAENSTSQMRLENGLKDYETRENLFKNREFDLCSRIEDLEKNISDISIEKEKIEKKLSSFEGQAEEYRNAKEKLPEIELYAYKRAEEIEQMAINNAERFKNQIKIESNLIKTRTIDECVAIKTNTEDAINKVSGELSAILNGLEGLLLESNNQLRAFHNQASLTSQNLNGIIDLLNKTNIADIAVDIAVTNEVTKSYNEIIESPVPQNEFKTLDMGNSSIEISNILEKSYEDDIVNFNYSLYEDDSDLDFTINLE